MKRRLGSRRISPPAVFLGGHIHLATVRNGDSEQRSGTTRTRLTNSRVNVYIQYSLFSHKNREGVHTFIHNFSLSKLHHLYCIPLKSTHCKFTKTYDNPTSETNMVNISVTQLTHSQPDFAPSTGSWHLSLETTGFPKRPSKIRNV